MIIAGIDEAGYGPLLGPLVVSATAFEVAERAAPAATDGGSPDRLTVPPEQLPCLWTLLKAAVAGKAPAPRGRIIVADSKVVHHLAEGEKLLERGVLAFAAAAGLVNVETTALTAAALIERLGCPQHGLAAHPWYAAHDAPLPWRCDSGDLAIATNMLATASARQHVKVVALRTRVLPERGYNVLVGATGNKAAACVSITLSHLHYLHTEFGARGLVVGVDKQGGREHYVSLLLQTFPDAQLRVLQESPEASAYELTDGARHTVVHFREKGETYFLPTALASMVCKYLRELLMAGFNAWWCAQIPDLRPTAGYYADGSRWLRDVAPHLSRLGVRREHLVRCR
jgi:hypothetical protein